MRPVETLDRAVTPARRRCRDGLCSGRPHAIRMDSAPLAESLSRSLSWLPPLREQLLEGRPALVRAEWFVRSQVWAALWASAVAFRLRPKPPPVPKEERRIALIPASSSYGDFLAEQLVVPDDVTCDEASLMGDLSVQGLHLLQDLYPIGTTHQPDASLDPDQRLRDAYPLLYRLIREPPSWHPELRNAARDGNLLGALAAGGPFAKLLERSEEGSAHPYTIDLRHMAAYPVRPGLALLGCRIDYDVVGGELRVAAVRYGAETASRGDARWDFLERIALCSLATHLTVWRHGMQYHVAGLAPVAVHTHNLPPDHPVRRLLAAHIWETISTNFYTHLTLRRNGFDVAGFSFPRDVMFRYYDDGARHFDLSRFDVRADTARRGIGANVHYPYLPLAQRYQDLIGEYVTAYVDLYYADDAAVVGDAALCEWFDALDASLVGGLAYCGPFSKASLVKFCTLFIYAVTVEHEQNTQWDYAVFLPNTVHADGGPQSVGEVRCVMDFQMIISLATNRLLGDLPYLALDERGAEVMRRFQASLRQLQAELEQEPDHYWHVYPEDLEASVSA